MSNLAVPLLTCTLRYLSTALREANTTAIEGDMKMSLEELLAQLQGGDVKRCDKDVGGCGAAARVRHDLVAPPSVFTISLAWDTAQATHRAAQADVAAAKAAVQQARLNLEYASVLAPISGRIGRSLVTEGALVSQTEATQLATIQQVVTVTISSELNVLVVGGLLVLFVVLAPEGLVGLYRKWKTSSK